MIRVLVLLVNKIVFDIFREYKTIENGKVLREELNNFGCIMGQKREREERILSIENKIFLLVIKT